MPFKKEFIKNMINIRDFTEQDRENFISMCTCFYSSDAVLYPLSQEAMSKTFDEIIKQSPYLRGLIIEYNSSISGYINLSLTYSNEANGLVVFLEEIYIKPEFQGKGLGTYALTWVLKEYSGIATRYRLEVCSSNSGAIKLYERLGFKNFEYKQMVIDIGK